MSDIEHRKRNLKWLLEGETDYKVFVKNEQLDCEIFNTHNAMRLYEDCFVDIYQQLEKGDGKIIEKLKTKIKTLEARILVLESHNKDDNSTIIH